MLRRIKRLLRKRNNGGFTLVEVIVAGALLAVLILGVFGFVQPVMRSVKQKEQNARAVMLCETIETYIANSTKYAYYVQTFSGVTAGDISSTAPAMAPIVDAKYTGTEYPDHADACLANMMNCMNSVLSADNYEIRCIGMRWLTDPKSGEKKLMLTNEVVDQKTGALDPTKSKLVFETCFYDGLYPVLEFGNYNNQYKVYDDATGTIIDKYDPADVKLAAGLEIKMSVYLEPYCYSKEQATRENASVTFIGTTYANFRNIANDMLNTTGEYKLHPNVEVHTYEEAFNISPTAVYNDSVVGETYYPDTFIFYLNRKNWAQETTTP